MEELLKLMKEYEAKNLVDCLRLVVYSDGSGYGKDSKTYSDNEVFDFDNIDQLKERLCE